MFFAIASVALSVALSGGPVSSSDLPTCETETSTNCFWDADIQGNGVGESFHDIEGVAYYACDGFEDSQGCFWDASKLGNNVGHSFTDVMGTAIYWRGLI